MSLGAIIDAHPIALDLTRCVGVPYWYGAGRPSTPWPPQKCDCSGFVLMSWVRLGWMPKSEGDHSAMDIANNLCVPTQAPEFGDVAVYPGHLMLYLGEGLVIGAAGGDHTTFGDNPRAFVKVYRYYYRPDFAAFGRLRTRIPLP